MYYMTLNKKQKLELYKIVQKTVMDFPNNEMFMRYMDIYGFKHKELFREFVLEDLDLSYSYYKIVEALGLKTTRNVNIKKNTNFLNAFNDLF